MQSTRRPSPLFVAVAALAFLVASCGVESGSDAASEDSPTTTTEETSTTEAPAPDETTTTEASSELSAEDQLALDSIVDVYEGFGLSNDEATCLAEGIIADMGTNGDMADTAAIMDIVNECDIPISKLSDIGSQSGGLTAEDGMEAGMAASFKNQGLTDAQADCLAGAYVDEFGTDVAAASDPQAILPLMESCDVSPTDFNN